VHELSEVLLASAQRHFEEAERHLSMLTSLVRDFAIPHREAACLTGFAKVALDRGGYARASRLLAAVKASVGPRDIPFRTNFDALVYNQCAGVLQDVLHPETARTTQAEGAALSVKDALDAELRRSGATATSNPTD
jgi:hypothetical protein